MASGDLLKKLFRSFKRQDTDAFYSAALEVIAEEKKKNHNVLAEDLQKILNNGNDHKFIPADRSFERLPQDKDKGTLLVEVKSSNRMLSDLVLSPDIADQITTILDEFRDGSVLRTYGLRPKQKILFAGPPGCGKTVTAEALATELGLPLLYTRFDAVISSLLGETAANLRKVFEFAQKGTWVVFFDEFDAIGKSRQDIGEHGELKRVVNTFLQLLDNFMSDSILIAATNHETLLDRAIWRRFDEIVYFNKPEPDEIRKLVAMRLRGFPHSGLNIDSFISSMHGWSHADIERATIDAIKMVIIAGESEVTNVFFRKAVEMQKNRMGVILQNS
ncbi:MAG: ATP-binding protein [Anaerolineales bacterium]|nr:ATP-binding protein [Anaerolineales bacterium]MCW5854713.1 ATP-binding protein [Anaerolineales bacterium]